MMYLIEVNKFEAFKKLFVYKLKANINLFYYFIVVQLIALLLTSGSSSMTRMGFEYYSLTVRGASGEMMIAFSILWVTTISIIITTKGFRNVDFTVMASRSISSLTNVSLLMIYSIFGGITASLSGVAIRVFTYFTKGSGNIVLENFILTPRDIAFGMIATTAYLIILCSIGYMIGTLIQLHKSFFVIIPVIVFLCFRIDVSTGVPIIVELAKIFINEKLIGVFVIKILLTSSVLFSISTLLACRLEVRR